MPLIPKKNKLRNDTKRVQKDLFQRIPTPNVRQVARRCVRGAVRLFRGAGLSQPADLEAAFSFICVGRESGDLN